MHSFEISVIVTQPLRADIFISALFSDISRSYVSKCIQNGSIRVNGKKIKKNTFLNYWDHISFQEIITSSHILPEEKKLDIIYEDQNLIVINKDPGINVHPVPWIDWKQGTLVNALLHYTRWSLPIISWEERPGIVHRLDKDTSGVMLIAKNDTMMQYLSKIIQQRNIKKYYFAVVGSIPMEKKFSIYSDIWRDRYNRTKMTIKNPINPKHAVTHVELIWNYDKRYGLVKIDLETWRTHQIRVHLASIGYHIIWDKVYGDQEKNLQAYKQFWVSRQLLHAWSLVFELYWKSVCFQAEMKQDMQIFFKESI